jgi:uncharacterized membrane protein YbhN (UPF0104 family)
VSSTETNAPTTENGIAAPRRPSLASRIVKISFGLAVLVFGAVYIGTRWDGVRDALSHAQPAWIVVAVICAAVGQWAAALSFGAVLRMIAPPLPILEVARVHFVSQLGKYIPGSIWPIVAITEMCRRYGIARRSAATAGVLALLYSLVVATILGLVLVLAASAGSAAGWWWLVAVIPLGIALVHPRVVGAAVDAVLRLLRRPPIELDLRWQTLRACLGWSALSWILLGLQCWALVIALGGDLGKSLAPAIGGFAVAYAAGTVFIPAPAGAGVREAVLGLALSGFGATAATLTHDDIVVVVLLSRVILAILDFAQAGVVLVLARHSSQRSTPQGSP